MLAVRTFLESSFGVYHTRRSHSQTLQSFYYKNITFEYASSVRLETTV